MAIIRFNDIGAIGIVKDLPAHELPPEAWSDGSNVRFHDGKVEKMLGHSQIFNISASATEQITINPWWLLQVSTGGNVYWVYAGKNKVYAAANNSNNNNITRYSTATASDVNYSATPNVRWNGGVIGGIPVLNNGEDEPQVWNPIGLSTRLIELDYDTSAGTKWSDASLKARVIRPYRNYLIALDVTKSGTRYPHMVKWSHPADPGAVPESWDETDTTKDTGEHDLADTKGYVIDCLPLHDTNIVYKEDAIHGMQYIGGSFIFRFYQITKAVGILSRDCVTKLHNQHIVLCASDVVALDGRNVKSIMDHRWRKWLDNNIDTTYYENSFIVRNHLYNEIWFCIPTTGVSPAYFPNTALIWNYKENTFTVRELPSTPFIGTGIVDFSSAVRTWSGIGGTWGSQTTGWGIRSYGASKESLVAAKSDSGTAASTPKLYLMDNTDQFDGVDMPSYIERKGLPIAGAGGNTQNLKYIKSVWPKIEAVAGTQLTITVGTQAHIGDTIAWGTSQTFTVGEAIKVDLRQTGRFISIRFETNTDNAWKLTGYDIDAELVGYY